MGRPGFHRLESEFKKIKDNLLAGHTTAGRNYHWNFVNNEEESQLSKNLNAKDVKDALVGVMKQFEHYDVMGSNCQHVAAAQWEKLKVLKEKEEKDDSEDESEDEEERDEEEE